jgi:AcrR family transcriptional regulator
MDLRIKRTRKFIREAFFELIHEKGFDPVTVGEITERAMINRSTFYRHYREKYDLAEKCLDEPFNALLEQIDQMEEKGEVIEGEPPKNFLLLFRHIEQNADQYRELFGRNGISIFISRLRWYILQLLRYRLRDAQWSQGEGQLPQSMFEEYLAGAYIGVIQWWLENLDDHPAEKVALWLYKLVVRGTDDALGLGERAS